MMEKLTVMTPTALTDQRHMTASLRMGLLLQTVELSAELKLVSDGQVSVRDGTP
jgi:hypothetical protein